MFETLTVREEGAVLFAEIAAPPMNLLGPELVRDLVSLIRRAEAGDAVQVLVFKSADPDYFISHVDVTRIGEYRAEAAKLTGDPSIALLFHHLSASRLVTIAQIEGRVRGAGSESRTGSMRSRLLRPRTSVAIPISSVKAYPLPRCKAGSAPRSSAASRPETRKWLWPGCWASWLTVDLLSGREVEGVRSS
jgi:hypothetical protein